MANAKEGDIKLIEGNRFILRNGKWRPEGKGEFGSEATTREANRLLKELRDSKAARGSSKPKPTAAKPKPKPPTKPQPAANAGMKNQDPSYRGNKSNKDSIASTLKDLKKMKRGSKDRQGIQRKVQGVGPVANGDRYAKRMSEPSKSATGQSVGGTKTPSQTNKEAKKPMTLAEKMRRRRMGLD